MKEDMRIKYLLSVFAYTDLAVFTILLGDLRRIVKESHDCSWPDSLDSVRSIIRQHDSELKMDFIIEEILRKTKG